METLMVNWKTAGQHHEYWLQHHRLRHEIFVDRLGWEVGSHDGLEFDEFDTPAAEYVLCLDEQQDVIGVSRLVCTEQPYMIEKFWSDWIDGELPKSQVIWEATRFGVSNALSATRRAEAIDAITRRIFRYGQENGIDEFLLVMPVFIYKRILIPRGYDLEIISPVRKIDQLSTAIARVRIPRPGIQADLGIYCADPKSKPRTKPSAMDLDGAIADMAQTACAHGLVEAR